MARCRRRGCRRGCRRLGWRRVRQRLRWRRRGRPDRLRRRWGGRSRWGRWCCLGSWCCRGRLGRRGRGRTGGGHDRWRRVRRRKVRPGGRGGGRPVRLRIPALAGRRRLWGGGRRRRRWRWVGSGRRRRPGDLVGCGSAAAGGPHGRLGGGRGGPGGPAGSGIIGGWVGTDARHRGRGPHLGRRGRDRAGTRAGAARRSRRILTGSSPGRLVVRLALRRHGRASCTRRAPPRRDRCWRLHDMAAVNHRTGQRRRRESRRRRP
jgi:hypothetical protein